MEITGVSDYRQIFTPGRRELVGSEVLGKGTDMMDATEHLTKSLQLIITFFNLFIMNSI